MKTKVLVLGAAAVAMTACGFAETWDVVVVGGTARAVQTAVAAKLAGAKTLLVAPRMLLSDDVAGQLRLDAYQNPLWEKLPHHFKLMREDVTNYPFATFTPNSAKGSLLQEVQTNGVPLRPLVSDAAAAKRGFFWCADDAAAKGCAAKAVAFAKTAKPGAAGKPVADAWPVLATVDVVVAGGGDDTRFHEKAVGVELVEVETGDTELPTPEETLKVKATKYTVRSTDDAFDVTPKEVDLTGKKEASLVLEFYESVKSFS